MYLLTGILFCPNISITQTNVIQLGGSLDGKPALLQLEVNGKSKPVFVWNLINRIQKSRPTSPSEHVAIRDVRRILQSNLADLNKDPYNTFLNSIYTAAVNTKIDFDKIKKQTQDSELRNLIFDRLIQKVHLQKVLLKDEIIQTLFEFPLMENQEQEITKIFSYYILGIQEQLLNNSDPKFQQNSKLLQKLNESLDENRHTLIDDFMQYSPQSTHNKIELVISDLNIELLTALQQQPRNAQEYFEQDIALRILTSSAYLDYELAEKFVYELSSINTDPLKSHPSYLKWEYQIIKQKLNYILLASHSKPDLLSKFIQLDFDFFSKEFQLPDPRIEIYAFYKDSNELKTYFISQFIKSKSKRTREQALLYLKNCSIYGTEINRITSFIFSQPNSAKTMLYIFEILSIAPDLFFLLEFKTALAKHLVLKSSNLITQNEAINANLLLRPNHLFNLVDILISLQYLKTKPDIHDNINYIFEFLFQLNPDIIGTTSFENIFNQVFEILNAKKNFIQDNPILNRIEYNPNINSQLMIKLLKLKAHFLTNKTFQKNIYEQIDTLAKRAASPQINLSQNQSSLLRCSELLFSL